MTRTTPLGAITRGILAGAVGKPRAALGVPFGAAVWATSYAVLPPAGLYRPIWEQDRVTLGKDLSAHLLFGATTGTAFKALLPGRDNRE